MTGTIVNDVHESRVLKGNPLRDPHIRKLPVYLPPSYFTSRRRFPVIFVLAGFGGAGEMQLHRRAWDESFPQRCDRMIRAKKMKEAIVVFPDAFTKYGGSQYLNSSAVGRYEDYIVREIVSYVDNMYRTIPRAGARAVMGRSSGGYGSLVLGMRHPDVFGLVACQSGDMYFEYCYFPDFPKYLTRLPRYGGTTKKFLQQFERARSKATSDFMLMINVVAMSACYAPNPRVPLGFDLPFDEKTGEIREAVWRRFLKWDPVRMAPKYRQKLKKLRLLFLECGRRDEYQLHHGARIFSTSLRKMGISHIHEEFDGGHRHIAFRDDRALEVLSRKLRTRP